MVIKQSSATIDRQPEREEEEATRERVSERAGVGVEGVEVSLASERGRARARASASARVRAPTTKHAHNEQDNLAERPEAMDRGASLKGRGLEPHTLSCHRGPNAQP